MDQKKRFAVILHVRVPDLLRGCDQQRYIERKLFEFGLRLRPPLMLADTGIPIGYGLVRTGLHGWNVLEARGEVAAGVRLLDLQQHELVEDAMEEGDEPEGVFASGGPMPSPITMGTIWITMMVLKPLTLIHRGVRSLRRWYVRERG